MYSDKRNVLQAVALLKAHGVRHIVLCPGSRNIPLVQAFSHAEEYACHAVTDERSAGFFALGLALQSGEPAAVCCTSGSALLNLHPAVAEAFYRRVPLIILSADRPAAWIGQMDGQTLPQPGVFGTLVKLSVSLPEVHTAEDEWYCNRLLNEALLETHHHGRGPVHINIPVSEPFFDFPLAELPSVRIIRREEGDTLWKRMQHELPTYAKVMIIGGQIDELCPHEVSKALVGKENYVWVSEHTNNHHAPAIALQPIDPLLKTLREDEARDLCPDVVITYGGHVLSKPLKQYLRKYKPKEHWHVSDGGGIADLFGALTLACESSVCDFLSHLPVDVSAERIAYREKWLSVARRVPTPYFPYSEMQAIGSLLSRLPVPSVLHLANSSAIRYAQLFPLPPGVEVRANRGVNGIEGSLSAAVGFAATDGRLNFVCIGDLSFFYDMNILWRAHPCNNLRILLLNNRGGEIFDALPGLSLDADARHFVMAPHAATASAWAESQGFGYFSAANEEELEEALASFTADLPGCKPLLLEVFTDREEDIRHLKAYYQRCRQAK